MKTVDTTATMTADDIRRAKTHKVLREVYGLSEKESVLTAVIMCVRPCEVEHEGAVIYPAPGDTIALTYCEPAQLDHFLTSGFFALVPPGWYPRHVRAWRWAKALPGRAWNALRSIFEHDASAGATVAILLVMALAIGALDGHGRDLAVRAAYQRGLFNGEVLGACRVDRLMYADGKQSDSANARKLDTWCAVQIAAIYAGRDPAKDVPK